MAASVDQINELIAAVRSRADAGDDEARLAFGSSGSITNPVINDSAVAGTYDTGVGIRDTSDGSNAMKSLLKGLADWVTGQVFSAQWDTLAFEAAWTGFASGYLDASSYFIAPALAPSSTARATGRRLLPNNYKNGTDLKPFLVWAPLDNNTGDVILRMDYGYATPGGVITPTSTSQLTVAAPGVTKQHVLSTFDDIDGSSFVKGGAFALSGVRVGGDPSDSYAAYVAVVAFGVKYQIDGVGSSSPFP